MNKKINIVIEWLGLIFRLILGVVFIYASIYKIIDPHSFALNIATYQIMPLSLINIMAICLPWVEMGTGIFIIIGLFTRQSALIIVGMNIMFISAILIAMNKELQIQCGCFASGEAAHQIGWDLVFRDILLLIISIFIIWQGPKLLALDRWIKTKCKICYK